MKLIQIAFLGAATLAVAQPHDHLHRHARRGSPLQARDATTTTVTGPVVTVYELNGQTIDEDDVEKGIKDGKYVLVGERISTVVAPSTSSTSTSTTSSSSTSTTSTSSTSTSTSETPTPTPTTSSVQDAQFLQVAATMSTTPTPEADPSTSAAAAPASSAAAAAEVVSDSSSSAKGLTASFPSGKIPCSQFPSDYGAVAAEYLGLGGWTGVQITPNYNLLSAAISYIETAVGGQGCTKNSFCSYACPPGYQKSQWPKAQGNTGQSIGGLYCNSKGYLELSRSEVSQICTAGVGGVKAKSSLSKNVALCRTDYPGTESETIATNVVSGGTVDVTCPDASEYYVWQSAATSAQYYINPSGYSVEEACTWGTPGSNLGNYAPVNMGVGKGLTGETFISLFPNHPSNMDGRLDFDIKITGSIGGSCSYKSSTNMYYSNGVAMAAGCTVSVSGGDAIFEFS